MTIDHGALSGKVAVVTGGGSGIGHAIASHFVGAGATVVVADVDGPAAGDVAAGLGAAATAAVHDVSSEASWAAVIRSCRDQHGRLDILVNNAGTAGSGKPQDLEHIELAEWHAILRVNLDGVMLGCRAAIPVLAQQGGGAIVNISSVTARLATPRAVAYGAAKAGVNHLTMSAALYCARRGYAIRCNGIEPGTIETPMSATVLGSGGGTDAARARIPLGELGRPADVAHAAVYLASDAARYVTGVTLPVDGGWSLPR